MKDKRKDAVVIALVSVAHGTSHFFQLVIAPLFPLIKEDFGVSYAALGFVVAVFYTLSAVGQPIAGFVVDRFGPRGVLLGGVGFMVAGIALAGLAPSYPLLVAGSALAGIGNAVFHPADFSIINSRVGVERLGYAYSVHGMGGSLGYASAPLFSGTMAALFGWHAALLAASAIGVGVLGAIVLFKEHLQVSVQGQLQAGVSLRRQMEVLLNAPVVLCFLYFAIFAAGLVGIQSFSVAAMTVQYGVSAALASAALTSYMMGSAAGILTGGFIAARARRHDVVAALGLAASASTILFVAVGAVPGAALPVMLALCGFFVGSTGPSRDMIVRASAPAGSTGRVYGFVYSGLDVGSLSLPVIYGWLMDHRLPQGVFLVVSGLTALAMLTVLRLPGRTRRAAAT